MSKLVGQLTFLIVRMEEWPENRQVLLQSNDYPIINTGGRTLDEAMERMCANLLVYLQSRRLDSPSDLHTVQKVGL